MCGETADIPAERLKNGQTRSCGCLRREVTSRRRKSHGLSKSPEYRAWSKAKGRCYTPSDSRYQHYGARGIEMCDEWRTDFGRFLADMGPRPTPDHTLERVDNDGPYSPQNCRWASYQRQTVNRSHTVWIDYRGRRFYMKELAAYLGLDYYSFRHFYRESELPLEEAIRLAKPA